MPQSFVPCILISPFTTHLYHHLPYHLFSTRATTITASAPVPSPLLLREPLLPLLRPNILRLHPIHTRRTGPLVQMPEKRLQRALIALCLARHLELPLEERPEKRGWEPDAAVGGVLDEACDAEVVGLLDGEGAVGVLAAWCTG